MQSTRKQDENFIIVATAEEYAYKHKMILSDVLHLFEKYNMFSILKSQYEVLHMLDISDSVSLVESIIERDKVCN